MPLSLPAEVMSTRRDVSSVATPPLTTVPFSVSLPAAASDCEAQILFAEAAASVFDVMTVWVMVLAILAERQHFSPTDTRAVRMISMAAFRPIYVGITYGLEILLLFIGLLTLGIGGIGVMNIMLVTVNERVREIGLRRALGARRRHIRWQFLAEALALTMAGGLIGVVLSVAIGELIGTLPFLGPAYEDTSGAVDIHMHVSGEILVISVAVLVIVGVLSGLVPAMRAARLDPVEALRYE